MEIAKFQDFIRSTFLGKKEHVSGALARFARSHFVFNSEGVVMSILMFRNTNSKLFSKRQVLFQTFKVYIYTHSNTTNRKENNATC